MYENRSWRPRKSRSLSTTRQRDAMQTNALLKCKQNTSNTLNDNKPQRDSSGVLRLLIWQIFQQASKSGGRQATTVRSKGANNQPSPRGRRRCGRTYLGGSTQKKLFVQRGEQSRGRSVAARRKHQVQVQQWRRNRQRRLSSYNFFFYKLYLL